MSKWIWLALLMLVAIATVVSGGGFFQQHQSPVSHRSESSTDVAVASEPTVRPPQVNPKKLFAHIKALNFKRYTSSERALARNYLTQSLKQFGWSPTLQEFEEEAEGRFNLASDSLSGVNILAERQGTDPQAGTILVAAHYDTVAVSPGADDNASGVAVVMEIARLFGSRPTPRTLQLVLFDREERGLLGSKAFVANKAHLEHLRGVIVMDMVAFACYTPGCQRYPAGLPITPPSHQGDFLAVVGDSEHLPLLNAFQKYNQPGLPSVLTLPVPLKGMLTPDTLRSDHAPFWYQGVGAVLVSDTANLRTPHYHQPSDTPPTLDRSFFTGAAQIVVNATTALLDGDDLETKL